MRRKKQSETIPFTKLKLCDWCKQGIGVKTFKNESVVKGEYCSMDHYVEAVMKKLNINQK